MKNRPNLPELTIEQRRQGFAEVKQALKPQWAVAEASRCLLCNDPPCENGCPAGVEVKNFIRALRSQNFRGALKYIRSKNILAGCCARVCPQSTLCEQKCSSTELAEPIAIGALQRFCADFALKGADQPPVPDGALAHIKVAVLGSGPAGLACAAHLALAGARVTIFELQSYPGGILTYGIPEYKLPKAIVFKEIDYIKALGVNLVPDAPPYTHAQLKALGYDYIFLGCGAGASRDMDVPGRELEGIALASQWLADINLRTIRGEPLPRLEGTVLVLGGGNVAVDCARSAVRLGAGEVYMVYRRTVEEAPAWKEELQAAEAEGVKFLWLTAPLGFLGEGGKLTAMQTVKMQLGEPDASGRPSPKPVAGSETEFKAAKVFLALGYAGPKTLGAFAPELQFNARGYLEVDARGATSLPGVYAGGDAINGGLTAVQAVKEGRTAAENIIHEITKA